MKAVFVDGQEIECFAIKPDRLNTNQCIVVSPWNQATPYRVWIYNIVEDRQAGSGAYCYTFEEAMGRFNEL